MLEILTCLKNDIIIVESFKTLQIIKYVIYMIYQGIKFSNTKLFNTKWYALF